jgi:hypothetical protein
MKQFLIAAVLFLMPFTVHAAESSAELSREVSADHSGQLAGSYTYQMRQCAKLEPKVTDDQRKKVQAELMADRSDYSDQVKIWDAGFISGQQQEQASKHSYSKAYCAKVLEHLLSQ